MQWIGRLFDKRIQSSVTEESETQSSKVPSEKDIGSIEQNRIAVSTERHADDGLVQQAINDPESQKRENAVNMLTDQKRLQQIVLECCYTQTCVAAINKITDPSFLAEIAIKDDRVVNVYVRENEYQSSSVNHFALQRIFTLQGIIDSDILFKVAMEADPLCRESAVRIEAMKHIPFTAEQLKQMALHGKKDHRHFAVSQITDPAILAEVAIRDEDIYICQDALKRLTDQHYLCEVAIHSKYHINELAVDRITAPALLMRVKTESRDKHIRAYIDQKKDRP